jgi:hypothetical protein
MRNGDLAGRRWVYLAGTPLLPPLLYGRMAAEVFRRGRHRGDFAAATPLILAYVTTWAAGEAVGYAAGGGHSMLRVR